jgi:hypothetical protein
MADTLTLLQLRTRARERADMVNSSFVTDTELTGYINSSYQEFYDLLTNAVEDYNISTSSFTIASGNTQAAPSDFYKVRGIDDMTDPSNPLPVRLFNFNERNDYSQRTLLPYRLSTVSYRILGSNLTFLPDTQAQRPYKLWYVPIATPLVLDADTAAGINGWLEYVVVDAAIKMLIKEESDTKVLYRVKKDLIDRIEAMRTKRDQSLPEKISRVRTRSSYHRTTFDGY